MGYYAIQANITIRTSNGYISRQVPTFYLHENVQGIVSEKHAREIARDIITSAHAIDDDQVHIIAVRI